VVQLAPVVEIEGEALVDGRLEVEASDAAARIATLIEDG
jgi:hypothetical protein